MCVTTYKGTHGVRTTLYAQVGDFPTPRGRITAAVRLGYLSRLHPYEGRTQTVPEPAHTADACPNKHPSAGNTCAAMTAGAAMPSRLSPGPRQSQLSSCRRRPRSSRRRTLRCARHVPLRGLATEGCVQAGRTIGGSEPGGRVRRFPQEDGQRLVGLLDLGVVGGPELTAGARGGGVIQGPGTLQSWGSSSHGRTGLPCSRLTTGRGELGAP